MFASWRFKIREVEEALKLGQLDQACQQLRREGLDQYLPGKKLASRIAMALAERARRTAEQGVSTTAWRDAETALQLTGEGGKLAKLRSELLDNGIRHVESQLAAGNTASAMRDLETLEKHMPAHQELQTLRLAAQRLQSAAHLARHGKFAEAESQLEFAINLRPDGQVLQRTLEQIRQRREESRPLYEALHHAMSAQTWSTVLSVADRLLELAPECRLAQDARKRAWARVGAQVSTRGLQQTQAWSEPHHRSVREDAAPSVLTDGLRRFALWIDGVGGYLVCPQDCVTLGQATPHNQVDIPIQGDLSRQHARIRRSGEGYTLEPLHDVSVNHRRIQTRVMLSDGDEIELGGGVRLRFRRPHALSASARLDFLSRHRTQPSVDGILLMAESCVLGPKWQNHVVCRDWSEDVVLYRQEDRIHCRALEPIEIDGQWYDGRGPLDGHSHVAGRDFSMSLEELDRCSTQPLL